MRDKDFDKLLNKRLRELGLARPWRDSRTLTTKQKAENLERIKVLKEARKREQLVDPGYVGVLE